MPERDEELLDARPLLLVGAGQRPRELAAVLSALAGTRAEIVGPEPIRPHGLADLEELFAQHGAEGLLLLEARRVPAEDLGFVRRFLERHVAWRMVVLGEDDKDAAAKKLLGLPRAQWLPWPPDLDQVGALLAPFARRRIEREPPRAPESQPAPRTELGALLEELAAAQVLAAPARARVAIARGPGQEVALARADLAAGLDPLLALARGLAEPSSAVEIEIRAARDGRVELSLDFTGEASAAAQVLDASSPLLLGMESAAEAARQAVRDLAEHGAQVELSSAKSGRSRLRVTGLPGDGAAARRGRRTERGSPKDPFA